MNDNDNSALESMSGLAQIDPIDLPTEAASCIPESIGSTVWPMTRAGLLMPRWELAWDAVNAVPRTGAYETMVSRYTDPRRHYHTLEHLAECFAAFDMISHHCERPYEVELAIWFHDAFHDVMRHDNEARSAQHALTTLTHSGADFLCAQRVSELVSISNHKKTAASVDGGILQDVDLWILGASPDRFWEYERQIRWEYPHVSNAQYCAGRIRILERLLERARSSGHLFHTPEFREELEHRAVANLTASIERLRQGNLASRYPMLHAME